jgi:hypothetical protein
MRNGISAAGSRLLLAGLILIALVGCQSATDSGKSQPAVSDTVALPATTVPVQADPEATAQPVSTQPQAPRTTRQAPPVTGGHVPAELVGAWSGGPGSQSGFRYEFSAAGTYRFTGILQQQAGPTFLLEEVGVVDVRGSRMLLKPQQAQFRREPPSSPNESWQQVNQPSRTVSWEVISAAGVDVLRLIDAASGGESSFVRDIP